MIFGRRKPAPPASSSAPTGLPELPNGYWWRVSKTPVTSGYDSWPYRVEIRTTRELVATKGFRDMTDTGVAEAARVLHRVFKKRLVTLENERRLLGNFPPNKLKGVK
ncbi:hypothetical protein ACU4IU_00015 [Brevibacterium sp. CSND-B09]|uniref:hypothetical protein n=1 Tax=Brevibacterium sp. CSND-B09 TaxID=3462571 RepID=UPI00406A7F50